MRSRQGNIPPHPSPVPSPSGRGRQPSFLLPCWGRVRHEKQEHKAPHYRKHPRPQARVCINHAQIPEGAHYELFSELTHMTEKDGLAGQS